ncbi:hypothetical protein [Paractinoplanes deccanensis]|uniref:hypothetical protein n=1 Tax=Paractinoplanes deccanensis TaxID=113561 RepID=UPI00367111BC
MCDYRTMLLSPRAVAALSAIAAALVVAFVVAPGPLAGVGGTGYAGERQLSAALQESFVDYWRSGDRNLSPALREVVDYWFRYHVAKAVIAALLLAVLVVLGARLWSAFARAGRGRAVLAAGAAVVTGLGLFAVVVVMANVQGAAAPFASLLPMLQDSPATGGLGQALEQIRQELGTAGQDRPALATMISDFALYHWALAAAGAVVLAASVIAAVAAWKSPTRRLPRSVGVLAAAWSLILAVVVAANISTAADPAPALLAFFQGGW